MLDVWKNKYAAFDKTQERTRTAIRRLESERQEVFAAQRRGLYSDEEFMKQKTEINNQIGEFEKLIQENRLIECDMDAVLTKVFKFVRNISEEWATAKLDTKLRLQKLVFEQSPQFDGVAFGTPETSPIFETKKAFHEGRSSLVTSRIIVMNYLKKASQLIPLMQVWNGDVRRFLARKPSPQSFAVTY